MELLHSQEFLFTIAFVIFVVAIWKPAGKALTGGLDSRAAKIRDELEEAHRTLEDYRRKQDQALKDATEILEAAKEEAELMRREGEEALKRSLAAREAQAKDRIAQAEQAAIQSVRARAVEIAVRAATGLMSETIDQNRAGALVDQAIEELPQRARA